MEFIKNKKNFIRLVYFIIFIILIIRLIIPNVTYSTHDIFTIPEVTYYNTIIFSFYFGLSFEYYLDGFNLIDIVFNIPNFWGSIILVIALILLLILIIRINKLGNGGILGLGIYSAILILSIPFFIEIYYFIENDLEFYFNLSEYLILLTSAIILFIGLILLLREPKKTIIGSKSKTNDNLSESNKNLLFHSQIIPFTLLFVCLILILKLFIPYYIYHNSHGIYGEIHFYFGLYIYFIIDFSNGYFHFSRYLNDLYLTGSIILIPTICILLVLSFLYPKLKNKNILRFGIISIILIVIHLVLFELIRTILMGGYLFFYFYNYDFFLLSIALIGLGTFSKTNALNRSKMNSVGIEGRDF